MDFHNDDQVGGNRCPNIFCRHHNDGYRYRENPSDFTTNSDSDHSVEKIRCTSAGCHLNKKRKLKSEELQYADG